MSNFVLLEGNVGKNPEYGETNGSKWGSFNMATHEYNFKNKDNDPPDWHLVKVYGHNAEICEEIRRGDRVIVCGKYRTEKWTTPKGEARQKQVVRVSSYDNREFIRITHKKPEETD